MGAIVSVEGGFGFLLTDYQVEAAEAADALFDELGLLVVSHSTIEGKLNGGAVFVERSRLLTHSTGTILCFSEEVFVPELDELEQLKKAAEGLGLPFAPSLVILHSVQSLYAAAG